jgi:hypothetical protein
MVLVGVRKDENDKVHLFLQNFWKEKEFVEVDHRYFEESEGWLYFTVLRAPATTLDNVSSRIYKQQAGPMLNAPAS